MTNKNKASELPQRERGIRIKYGRIANQDLQSGIERLSQFTGWSDSKDIWRFAKFNEWFRREEKKARIYYKGLIDKHAEREPVKKMSSITNKMEDARDKDGKVITRPKQGPGPNGQVSFIFKDQEAFNADIKKFDNHVATCNIFKFPAHDMETAKLTPTELAACAIMIDNPPEDLAEFADDSEEILRDELFDETDAAILRDGDKTEEEEEGTEAAPPSDEPQEAHA